MQFRLIYRGPLPSGRHVQYKHRIRKAIHGQLAELWKVHPFLRNWWHSQGAVGLQTVLSEHARCGFRFMPLLGGRFKHTACALDILFLRRDDPGNLVVTGSGGGDIDNRIKVLFDALKMPQECAELGGNTPAADEDPFFCLLADDRLITEVKVTTDRLLTPQAGGEHVNDVDLVIHVRTVVTNFDNLPGLSAFLT